MKKIISVILVCSMILLCSATVFASETETNNESYSLDKLFTDYKENTFSDMLEFIGANPYAYGFLEFFNESLVGERVYSFYIHTTGVLTSGRVPKLEAVGLSPDNCADYLLSFAGVTTPNLSAHDPLVGEVGNKVMTIELNEGFVNYVNSLDRVEGNKLILNFLMNMISNEEVVGVSWGYDDNVYGDNANTEQTVIIGDCNGDGVVNGVDGYLMKIAIVGYVNNVDPFAIDMNGDGRITATDSLLLKQKIVIG